MHGCVFACMHVYARARFKTVGAPGQDIFRGDVSCQTHFFRVEGGEGGSEAPFGGGPFGGGGGGLSLPCPKSGPEFA